MSDDKTLTGIPKGNTVAIVGDPGSGKTTILLTFFRHACLQQGMVHLINDKRVLDDFNRLIWKSSDRNNSEASGADANDQCHKSIHCFISFESSFKRICETHGSLLSLRKKVLENGEENANTNGNGDSEQQNVIDGNNKDIFVFVDATSMLSGRLEDSLRYANLNSRKGDSPSSNGWIRRELRVKECPGKSNYEDSGLPLLRCLYWQKENGQLVPVENSEQNYSESSGNGENNWILPSTEGKPLYLYLDIIGPPIADPYERVRLLKDLLAELFSRYMDHEARFLSLDSLSALLEELDDRWKTQEKNIYSHRRLNILNLVRWLEENEVTTFMACEAKRTDATLRGQPLFLGSEERYLASGIIQLNYHRYRSGDLVRYFRIMKMRGAAHDMRAYAYELDNKLGFKWIEQLFGDTRESFVHD